MLRAFSFARTLLKARRHGADRPHLLTYIVTFTCNARCIMCDSWRKPSPHDLRLDEIERIFRQLPVLDAVRLSGGEPFVRKDLPDIVELARRELRPLGMHITTNGFLSDRIVELCEQRDRSLPLQLMVSIDGTESEHDRIRGMDRAFERAWSTLERLAPRQRELNLRLCVNQTVVDEQGVLQYPLLRQRLHRLGVNHQVVLAYESSATYSLTRELDVAPREVGSFATFGKVDEGLLRALFDDVAEDLRRLPWPERIAKRYYLQGIRGRLLDGKGEPNPACVALGAHLRMLPDGTVPTCQFNTRSIGNLREQSFDEVWSGLKARQQRDWVRRCAGCWAECEVLPSAIYTGDIARAATPRFARRGSGARLLAAR